MVNASSFQCCGAQATLTQEQLYVVKHCLEKHRLFSRTHKPCIFFLFFLQMKQMPFHLSRVHICTQMGMGHAGPRQTRTNTTYVQKVIYLVFA